MFIVICFFYRHLVVLLIHDGHNLYVCSYVNKVIYISISSLLASELFWTTVARAFGSSIKRIAFEGAIKNDDFRSPTTRLVLGDDPWVHLVQDNVK